MLNISPFSYGLIIQQVYDNGSVYSPEVLDITEASLHARFLEVRIGWNNLAWVVSEFSVSQKLFFPLRVWGILLVCVWRLATPLWLLSPTPSSVATRESWLLLWRLTTPSPWQTKYGFYIFQTALAILSVNTQYLTWTWKWSFALTEN